MEINPSKERIGYDFDNTLTRMPFPFSFLNKHLGPRQRAKILFHLYCFFALKLPIFLHLERLEAIKFFENDFEFYIITGRSKSIKKIITLLQKYDYDEIFRAIYAPDELKVSTEFFKEKFCRSLALDYFFDDNKYIVSYLRSKGIKAFLI